MTAVYGVELGGRPPALETRDLTVSREGRALVKGVSIVVPANRILAVVGPSGCGKTTLLKCLNRLSDLDSGLRVRGEILLHGESILAPPTDPADVRRRVGMVFQRPTPFPTSVFENVAFGPKVNRLEGDLSRRVEDALRRVGLWDEVSDRLFESAGRLSAGQQQRLCIARALAVAPEVLLMDEPTSALDVQASRQIEELVHTLKGELTVVLVTNSLQLAARVSDYTAFLAEGELVEYGPTARLFTNPREDRTERYFTGRER